jgi:hypothetical protein
MSNARHKKKRRPVDALENMDLNIKEEKPTP